MTRVIHTGDTHVGYQQYHSPERRADFRRAFAAVAEDAIEAEVDAVVHAGDLFHDRRPELQDLMAVLSTLRRLDEADIPFLAVVGNHEATRTGEWLDLFEETALATRLGTEPVTVGDVAFYGLDWVPESRRPDLSYEFEAHDADYAALVSHGLFTPFDFGEWDTETVLSESSVDFDAMLLGDNHKPDTAEVLDTWVTYCGSTERASASERDARGYNLITFDEAGVDIRRRSLETRPFAFVSVELSEGEGVERVREQVRQHDLADAVCIVEITGEGEPITPASVEEAATEEGALIVRVTDRREIQEEADIGVSFADPDEAVRERVSELGLSTAARGIDETVRASKTADSNVREEVKGRVSDLLEQEPDAFVSAGEGDHDPVDDSNTAEVESETNADADPDPDQEPSASDDSPPEPDAQGTIEEYR
ncbi:DNA double-strand break repair protein Mre11 [Halolamina sp.]|jgi:DNA repair exonuclease SbcCD nuclease subunit|uniref:DNA double-strand break repair protein Mre11 n=1 Tax=Halolamina sp. TaxID=1940283 RepID=UPI000223B713|nr:metallophosphoesterase [halophilic archaeon DL31]